MKKLIILFLSLLCLFSCIKKRAIKYDPDLAGMWVAASDNNVFCWLKVDADGDGVYRIYGDGEDAEHKGQVKYSLFELRMWIGDAKFKVKEWLTADMKDVSVILAKDYETLDSKKYEVDRRMVLKTTLFKSHRLITFYRIKQ